MHYIPQVWQSPQNLTTEQLIGEKNNGSLRSVRKLWWFPLWWSFRDLSRHRQRCASTRSLLLLGRTIRRGLWLAGQFPVSWLLLWNLFWYSKLRRQNQVEGGQLNMCHTLPRIGYKSPYNRRVESRDSEAGEAGRPKGNPPIVATYSHPWNPEIRPSS